jgi:hypothetical protein
VWEDHLLPLLTAKDAARLGTTCRALRVVAREHFHGDLGRFIPDFLQAALTAFPRAQSVVLEGGLGEWEEKAVVEWLRRGGHGLDLTTVRASGGVTEKGIHGLIHAALRRGALPSLQSIAVDLDVKNQRASLTRGRLGGMHKLSLRIDCKDESTLEPQLAALGLVRQLPALATLKIDVAARDAASPVEQWPPFIPPSLKQLSVSVRDPPPVDLSLLGALSGGLGASGAALERLEIDICDEFETLEEGLVHVAQALRCCSQTLKGFCLSTDDDGIENPWRTDEKAADGTRLGAQWADVLAGVSACHELQALVLPSVVIEPVFPPGTAFHGLTHLVISDCERERGGLWELMASGELPVLAKLRVKLEGWWGEKEDVISRMAPGLEAVAGTLTHLYLSVSPKYQVRTCERDLGYELGLAVGKLRRLKGLTLDVSQYGSTYNAFAQGLAAIGGGPPSAASLECRRAIRLEAEC